MDQKKEKYFRRKLEDLKAQYTETVDSLNQGLLESMSESISELSLYDNHPGDVASEIFEREKDLGLKLYTQQQMDLVEEALQRLEKGQYGVCEQCGEKISEERLETLPLASLCVSCSRKNQLETYSYNNKARRPKEEQVIMPPFGGKFTKDNAFDGEDAWQAVAKYGTSQSPNEIGARSYNDMYIDYDENVGYVEDYEQIPVYKDYDGQFYQDFLGQDDETIPIGEVNKKNKSDQRHNNRKG